VPIFLPTSAPGAPAALLEFHPYLTLSEQYTDNFNRTSEVKTHDFRTALTPGINVLINNPVINGALSASVSEVYDSATESRTTFCCTLTATINWLVTPRLSFHLTDSLVRTDQPEAADRLGLRTGRQTFTSNSLVFSANYLIADVSTSAYYRLSTFSDASNDTTSQAFGATASKTVLETNTVSLGYEYLDSHTSGTTTVPSVITAPSAPNFNALGGLPIAGTRGSQVTASVSHQFNADLNGGLSGSWAHRTPQNNSPIQHPFTLWSASVFSSYTLGRLTTTSNIGFSQVSSETAGTIHAITSFSNITYAFPVGAATLSFDRGYSETFSTGQNFGVIETQGVTASYSYPLTPTASAYASLFCRENKNTALTVRTIPTQAYGASIGLTVPLLRWLLFTADYQHLEQIETGGDISSNTFRVTLSASF